MNITLSLKDDKGLTLFEATDHFDQIVVLVFKMFKALGVEVSRIDARIGCGGNWIGYYGEVK